MAESLPARTLSVTIRRDWREVYDFACQPLNFPRWASGLAESLREAGDHWVAAAPEGEARVWFSPHNDQGVLDHRVELPGGLLLYIPLRVIANGDGAEVMLTLFRQPGVDDEAFARDAQWVLKDLQALKLLLEKGR
ncbi:polyketide cyclase [Solimonas fluminis]|uniref:Polyketide cyclase n=1 Tax=Solimonas fluminis TaxID=2086571 RepID=A0A2S5TM39_9GAMM|nr:polyketide cyclase [Solimonas fluminis]PPE76022.1 polyketide cyclase [Solimonas fluminis]